MEISRKVAALPRGLEIGETVVYVGHRECRIENGEIGPGVFTAYKPSRVDLVVEVEDPADLPAYALWLKGRIGEHARLVKVERVGETVEMDLD